MKKYIPELKKTLLLAYPIILGQVGQLTVNIADNIMLGQYSKISFSAASVANSIFFYFFPFALGITSSLSILVPESDAQGNHTRIKKLIFNGLIIGFLLSLLIFISGELLYPLTKYLGQPQEILDVMKGYTSIIMFSYIPMILFFVFRFTADGLSKTKAAMFAIITGNIINVVVNYALIFGKFGFKEMGLEGAGIGTLISRIFMMIFMILLFFKIKSFNIYMKNISFKLIDKLVIKDIFRIGIPSSFQLFFEIGAFATVSILMGHFGTDYIAAGQVTGQMVNVTFLIITGVGVATTIRTGNLFGLKKFEEIKFITRASVILITGYMVLMVIIFIIFRNKIPLIFNDDPRVVEISSLLLVISSLFLVSDGIQVIISSSLRGIQDVKIPTIFTFISYWVIALPLGYFLFGKIYDFKGLGVWMGLGVGITISAIFLYLRFNSLIKKKF